MLRLDPPQSLRQETYEVVITLKTFQMVPLFSFSFLIKEVKKIKKVSRAKSTKKFSSMTRQIDPKSRD